MTYIPYWYSSGATGGGGGNQGDPIPDSLRFRGTEYLSRNLGWSDTTTLSMWVKRGTLGSEQYLVGSAASAIYLQMLFLAGNELQGDNVGVGSSSVDVFRDPGAWYHIVYVRSNSANTARLYVNGQEVQYNNVSTSTGSNTSPIPFAIGAVSNGAAPFNGYMADVYFIDGQALLPTAFGRENDDGVWVPREVDFTPAEMRWSDFLFADQTGNNTNAPNFDATTPAQAAEFAFNGSTTSGASAAGAASTIIFRPAEPIEGVTGLRVFTDNQARIWVNETLSNITQGATAGWADLGGAGSAITFPLDLTNLALNGNAGVGASGSLNAIEVTDANGTRILTNPFIWSADLFTSPSAANPLANPTGKDFGAGAGPGNAFEQADNRVAEVASSGMWMSWIPTDGYTFTNSIQVSTLRSDTANTTVRVTVDGVQTELSYTSGVNPYHWDFSGSGTLERIDIRNSLAPEGLYYITIDGQRLVDGVNSSYGANGFHLTFADPDDLGHDSSGNENDFTANNFNTDPVGIFSNDLTGTTGVNNPVNAFDGNTATSATGNNANESLTFAPTNPITVTNGVSLFSGMALGGTVTWNGTTVPRTTQTWTTVPGSGELSAAFPVVLDSTGAASAPFLAAVAINGTATENILVDNTGADYDSMQDSPTQNYATLNPLDPFASTTIDANLGITAGAAREFAPGTIAMADNRFYVELNCDQPPVNPPNRQYIVYIVPSSGVDNSTPSLSTGAYEVKVSSGTDFEVETNNAPVVAGTLSSAPGANFTMQVLYNAGTRQLYCSIDNANWLRNDGTISTAFDESEPTIVLPEPASGSYTIGCNIYNGTGNINYGQQPFVYTPPTGFERLQTQNMPAATIADGSDNFRALTGAGANILAIAQGTNTTGDNWNPDVNTGFTNGLWWIKDMVNSNQHQLVDSVRGNTTALQCPNKQEAAYIAPAGDSVAWCWNAPDTFTPTVTGGLTNVTARRNVDAGFSIIAYTGSAQTGTITHGLDESPEFMITKIRSSALGDGTAQPIFQVRHKDLTGGMTSVTGAGGILALNLPNAQFGNTHGTVTVTADGTGIQTNIAGGQTGTADSLWWQSGADGEDYIAYCWHSVPGYSAFGSYTGNSDPDGPFIYTGFRPAFILYKCSTTSSNWSIRDSTRNPFNPANAALFPNLERDELVNSDNDVDLLSNGFKIRNGDGDQNMTGETWVWAAFAENPFGGNNVSPANAR